jgi:putative transposase
VSKSFALSHDGKWIGKSQLQEELKGKYPMHSQSIQAVAHKYLYARDAAYKANLKGYKNKYPWRKKENFNTKWVDKAFRIEGNNLYLSMGIENGKRRKPIKLKVAKLPSFPIKEMELIYDRKLMLSISYDDGIKPSENNNTNKCAVDLGEIHSIASYCDNGEAIIITGRRLRSINRLRNKKLAELQKLMSKCTKGSRQWKKYKKAKQYVLSKSENQLRDCAHKTSKQFVDWCRSNGVKEVAVGDVDGVQRNTRHKKKKTVTQKLSNWNFGKLQQYLKYKLNVQGINMIKQEERYTTQQCPCCGRHHKPSGRNYSCKCGYKAHRDIHAARNILSKRLNGKILYIGDISNIKYERIA